MKITKKQDSQRKDGRAQVEKYFSSKGYKIKTQWTEYGQSRIFESLEIYSKEDSFCMTFMYYPNLHGDISVRYLKQLPVGG